jgi:EamA domain-containing membrane protein RarD
MNGWKLLSFVIVWVALAIFSVSALRDDRAHRASLESTASPG